MVSRNEFGIKSADRTRKEKLLKIRSMLIAAFALLGASVAHAQSTTTVSALPENTAPTPADNLYVEHGGGTSGAGCPGTPTSSPPCNGYRMTLGDLQAYSGAPVSVIGYYPSTVTPGTGVDYRSGNVGSNVDESVYFQAAITAACAGSHVVVVPATAFPTFYNFKNAVIPCSGLTIEGAGGGPVPVVANFATSGQTIGLQGSLFLYGNVHNAYLENIANFPSSGSVYYSTNAITAGSTSVPLTTLGDKVHFSVGDQVYVASSTYTTVGGFGLADYGFLDRITAINAGSGVITVAYPIDTALSSGVITDLHSNLARQSIPLFFCEHCSLKNLNVYSSASSNWMSDSACLDCRFENLITNAPCGPYGNMMQYTWWIDNTYNFSSCMGQWGANSLNSFDINGKYNFIAQAGVTPSGGWTFNERSRGIQLLNPQVNLGSFAPGSGSPVFFMIDTQHSRIINPQVQGAGYATSAIFIGSAGTSTFNIYDNVVDGGVINLATLSRWVDIDGGSVAYTHDNGIRNIQLLGTPTALSTAVWFNNSSVNNFFDNNRTATGSGGQLAFSGGAFSNNHIYNDYIDGGWATEILTQLQPNDAHGITSAAWLTKQAAYNTITPLIPMTANTSTVVWDSGATDSTYDQFDVLNVNVSFISIGSSGDTFDIETYDSAGPTTTPFYTVTLSPSTWYAWNGTLNFVTPSQYLLLNQGVGGGGFQQSYTPSGTLHIRLKGTSVNTVDNFIVGSMKMWITNPFYGQ